MVSNTLRDARLTRSWSSADKVYPLLVDVRSDEANDETTAPSNNAVAAGVAAAPTGMLAPDRVTTLSVSLIRMVQSDQTAALESHSW